MKQLTCEMCGGTDLIKQDGVFVCQSCGCKYSVEEAKKLLVDVDGVVEVTGTVKVDKSNDLENLYKIARMAKVNRDAESAIRYYEMIAMQDPSNWEAIFYPIYFRATQCKVGEINNAVISLSNCFVNVISLIKQNGERPENKKAALKEIVAACNAIADSIYESTYSTEATFADNYKRRIKTADMLTDLGQAISDRLSDFEDDTALIAIDAWKAARELYYKTFKTLGSLSKEQRNVCKNIIDTIDNKLIKGLEEAYAKKLQKDINEKYGDIAANASEALKYLYKHAREAKREKGFAAIIATIIFYDKILSIDPTSWEAAFYTVYYKVLKQEEEDKPKVNKYKEKYFIGYTLTVANCLDKVLQLIKDNVKGKENQVKKVKEVVKQWTNLYNRQYKTVYGKQDYFLFDVRDAYYHLGDTIETLFKDYRELDSTIVSIWKKVIEKDNKFMPTTKAESYGSRRALLEKYIKKVQKYEPDYSIDIKKSDGGCYVATAVYGSYDCPPVWTLRRYRDYTLAKTWYGRLFIYLYYAISPTIVKWFGNTEWFKKMWKSKLDRMVANLQAEGIESTPYDDINW